jgi:hypothetical protein
LFEVRSRDAQRFAILVLETGFIRRHRKSMSGHVEPSSSRYEEDPIEQSRQDVWLIEVRRSIEKAFDR